MPSVLQRITRAGLFAVAFTGSVAMAQTAICYNCPTEWADWGTQLRAIKAKTGITVPADNKNSGQALAQLVAEKASPVADVTYLGVTFAIQAQKDGVVAAYKPAAWAEIPDGLKDPAGHWFTIHSGTLGFMVNVDALKGKPVAGMRIGPNGDRVVSVSIPLRHVEAVLGVLTLESGDVDEIIAAERRALLPFIIMAVAVSLASSFLLNQLIAQPVLRLARAADRVRLSRARAIILPDLADREDELGDLTRSLQSMTSALTSRMDAIERFAADVAHEIRNPLTSIRSAVETLDIVSEPASRAKLMGILKQDVGRLDRLITDISNASRLDAELSRDAPRPIDLPRLLSDLSALYGESAKPGDVKVVIVEPEGFEGLTISGREGPLSQVFRNLIDNARSFTGKADSGERQVRIEIGKFGSEARVTIEDDGPGIAESHRGALAALMEPKSAAANVYCTSSGVMSLPAPKVRAMASARSISTS